jgi:hypothetical protein
MKPIYLEYTELSLALAEISDRCNLNLLEVLSNNCLIQRQKVSTVTELMEVLNTEESLFEEVSNLPTLVDIQNIELTPKLVEIIASCETPNPIFICSTINDSLDAETKKHCKKFGLEVVSLKKINPEIAKNTARIYSSNIDIKASPKKIEDLVAQCISYFEILDSLDFIALSDDQNQAIDSMLKPFKLQLFMRGFNPNPLSIKEIQPWVKDVDEGELQLALSLIFTKLSKLDSPLSKKLLQELILTDQRIKTRAKISPLIWYRLFLYKCLN